MGTPPARRPRSAPRPLIEELERRQLFSADVAPWVVDPGTDGAEKESIPLANPEVERRFAPGGAESDAPGDADLAPGLRIVLIDAGLDDLDTLVGAVEAEATVVRFDARSDSLDEVLGEVGSLAHSLGESIESLTVLSHGDGGRIQLGHDAMTATLSAGQAEAWRTLGHQLEEGANIAFFGCNVVDGSGEGQALLDRIAILTGADVFASDDLTGQGGDWQLEAASAGGADELAAGIETGLREGALGRYAGTLVDYSETGFSGNGAYSDGAVTFGVELIGGGTIDWDYDGTTDTFQITGSAGTTAATRLAITDSNGGLVVGDLVIDSDLGRIDIGADVGSIQVADGAHVGVISLAGGAHTASTIQFAGDVDGSTSILASVDQLTLSQDLNAALVVSGDVGTLHLAGTSNQSVGVLGDLDRFEAPLGFAGALQVGSAQGSFDVVDGVHVESTSYGVATSVLYDGAAQSLSSTDTDLLGHWRLDGDATDASGNGFDGSMVNGDGDEFTAGHVGSGALDLEGDDEYVTTAPGQVPQLTSDYTTSIWIHPDGAQKNWAGLFTATNASGSTNHWNLQYDGGANDIVVYHGNASHWTTGITASELNDGEWHHIVIVRTGTTMTAYLDGVVQNSGIYTPAPLGGAHHLNIGADRTQLQDYVFRGQLDDLRVYGRALTSTEIALLSGTGTPVQNQAPVADAGLDRSVMASDPVQLDAGASSDPDGDALTFSWQQTGGPPVSLAGDGTATPTFNAPSVGAPTVLTFEVTVDDGELIHTDTVLVTVDPAPSTPDDITDLVGHWRLDGNALDSSGNDYHGSPIGAEGDEFGPGQVGSGAFQPDGGDDLIQTGSGDVPQLGGDYTTSLWIRPDAVQKPYAGLYSATDASGSTNHWTLQFDASSQRQLVVNHNGARWNTGVVLDDLDDGSWHHIVIQRSGTGMNLFVDGSVVASGTLGQNALLGADHLNIGGDRTGMDNYVYAGGLDDLRVYDRALNEAEIDVLFDRSNAPPSAHPGAAHPVEDIEQPITLTGSDPDAGDSIAFYRIETLPTGTLRLAGAPVTVGTIVSQSQMDAGLLTYTSPQDWSGATAFEFSVSDGNVWSSATATFDLNVAAANDAPSVDLDAGEPGLDFGATFNETGGPVAITRPDASVGDVDGDAIQTLVVTLTNAQDGNDEVLAADTTGTSIAALYDAATHTLTLTGPGSAADFEQVLRTVTYDNLSLDPSLLDRTVEFVASDGVDRSLTATTTVQINAINTPPSLGDQSLSVVELAGTGTPVGSVAASDVDGSIVLYEIVGGNGDGAFAIDGATGAIRVANGSGLDHETVGARVLSVRVTDDLGLTATANVTIDLIDQNESPWHSLPAVPTITEGDVLVLSSSSGNAVTVGDLDGGDEVIEMTLTAHGGTLTLAGNTGLTFMVGDGIDDATMQIRGTLSDINSALDGLTYRSELLFAGRGSIQFETNDLGGSSGGLPLTGLAQLDITVEPLPPPPEEPEPDPEPGDGDPADEGGDEEGGPGQDEGVGEPGDDGIEANAPVEDDALFAPPQGDDPFGGGSGGPPTLEADFSTELNQLLGRSNPASVEAIAAFLEQEAAERLLGTSGLGETSLLRADLDTELQGELDRIEAELSEDADRQQEEIEVSIARVEQAGFAISAGILALLTRGTSLVGLALSALPVWSRVDPLAVLAISERTRRASELEQLDALAEEDEANSDLGRMLDRAAGPTPEAGPDDDAPRDEADDRRRS